MCVDSADTGGNDKFVIASITTLNSMFANLTMFLLETLVFSSDEISIPLYCQVRIFLVNHEV